MGTNPKGYPLGGRYALERRRGGVWSHIPPCSLGYILPRRLARGKHRFGVGGSSLSPQRSLTAMTTWRSPPWYRRRPQSGCSCGERPREPAWHRRARRARQRARLLLELGKAAKLLSSHHAWPVRWSDSNACRNWACHDPAWIGWHCRHCSASVWPHNYGDDVSDTAGNIKNIIDVEKVSKELEKIIDLPQIQLEEKTADVPEEITNQDIKHVPEIATQDVIVPKVMQASMSRAAVAKGPGPWRDAYVYDDDAPAPFERRDSTIDDDAYVHDWASAAIPPSIRRPWRVFEEDIDDKIEEAQAEEQFVSTALCDWRATVKSKGAYLAFSELSATVRSSFVEVSFMELAAFVAFRNSKAAELNGSDSCMRAWDSLDCDDKAEWVPTSPQDVLAADPVFSPLVPNVLVKETAEVPQIIETTTEQRRRLIKETAGARARATQQAAGLSAPDTTPPRWMGRPQLPPSLVAVARSTESEIQSIADLAASVAATDAPISIESSPESLPSSMQELLEVSLLGRPPESLVDFLWNVHVLLEAQTEPLPIEELKDAYSKHLGHKFPIERFLVIDKGGLQATLKRIPHIVKIYTEMEGGPLLVKASQPAGTTKETLIEVDHDYRKQVVASGGPHWNQRMLEGPITPALVTPPSMPGPWRSGFIFSEETPCASKEVPNRSRVVSFDLTASPAASDHVSPPAKASRTRRRRLD